MKDFVRKHVEDELYCLHENKAEVREIADMIREEKCTASREYLVLFKRLSKIQRAINSSRDEEKEVYLYRYRRKMSWVAISFKMNVSEATVKRYNRKLLEDVASSLGWV